MVTWFDGSKGGMPPVTAPGAITMDERPGDYLEARHRLVDVPRAFGASRYPAPQRADLVTLWKRGREPVLSITAGGKVHDFHLPPARLAVLLREVADMISEHTILQ